MTNIPIEIAGGLLTPGPIGGIPGAPPGLDPMDPRALGMEPAVQEEAREQVPTFAEPEALDLDLETREKIAETIEQLYRETNQSRQAWSKRHQDYDMMFRGQLDTARDGPWPNSSNLHVQMPYWLADAYNVRLVDGIWGQIPLVAGKPTEDADNEVARKSAALVDWHFQTKRMNARAAWARISKTRCIHGRGVGILPWVKDEYTYRVAGEVEYARDENDRIVNDENGDPKVKEGSSKPVLKRATRMHGPLLLPVEWDDVIEPMEGINLQPVCPSNPLGADFVGVRQWEPLSLIWKKRKSSYTYIEDDEDLKDRAKWVDLAPSQDRSGSGNSGTENQQRVKLQDRVTGKDRGLAHAARSPKARPNPEFEIISWFMPWMMENELGEEEETECLFFYMTEPSKVIGAFRLSDIQWKNKRPLIELDFQTVGVRRDSMGIMEIVQHLSAELDTIHNMRIDVGFATNMPFFFFRATSTINPERIVLRPGKGIPVDDVRDIQFPQLQSVTTFYEKEEQLLYSLVERVLGVTDLFLGVSPTRGAAARHATGFVGTQQEALARTSEIINQDAREFSNLCHQVYEAEMQFGPDERIIRLQGEAGPLTHELSRDELWYRGEYDFSLGANHGLYSTMMKQEQGQTLMNIAQVSPFINESLDRRWEVENFVLEGAGFPDPHLFIGPKSATGISPQKDASEENGEMDQARYGPGVAAPVHPNDNDPEHLKTHQDHLASKEYYELGRPNEQAHLAHINATKAATQRKQQMAEQQQMQMQAEGAGNPGANPAGQKGPPPGGKQSSQGDARNVASLKGVESQGGMGDVGASPAGGPPSPNGAPR